MFVKLYKTRSAPRRELRQTVARVGGSLALAQRAEPAVRLPDSGRSVAGDDDWLSGLAG